ncbi:MAG: sulfatase [Verrucomicrobiota bacterium]
MKFLLVPLSLAAIGATQARPALEKPNVVVVLLDDCGYGDFSHTGNPTIRTPNVSRLVNEGANFPQFYAASPACTASRYALLTGRNPGRSGLGTWVLGPDSTRHLHPKEVTLAEGLKARGYATGIFGKWHLGSPNKKNGFTADAFPLAHGFDVWEGTNVSNDYPQEANLIRSNPAGAEPIPGYEIVAKNLAADVSIQEGLTQRYRDLSVKFIREHREKPFFLYLAPNMPHLPVHAGKEFQGKSKRGLYGDCIEEIDAMLGSVVKALEDAGIARNTLVIFTSDNGPWIKFQDTASDALHGEARLRIGSALPFRDGKGSTWEGGVREVGVWYWPGTIPPATVVDTPASTMDILPTAFALAGEPLPVGRTLDGRDIRHFFNGAQFPGEVPDFHFIYTGASDNGVYGARKGPWKLHTRLYSQTGATYGFAATDDAPLLFNVEQDCGERIDRRAEQPAVVAGLRELIENFRASLKTEKPFWDDR